ncbi:hypothetical protein V2J09_003332 [Rumex salicifolius]
MSSTSDKSSTYSNNGNVYKGSDYSSSSFSEIEEINEEDGNKESLIASSKRLDHIKEDEISRLCPNEGSRDDDQDIVYVVVGKSETSTKALQWALYNAVNPITSTLYLIHVFPELKLVPSPLGNGKVPRSQVRKETLDMYLEEERTKRRQLLNKFIDTCNAHRVKVEETFLIESDMEAKAILELISVLNIQKLVLGVSKSDLRRRLISVKSRKDPFEDNPLAQTHVENPGEADDNYQTTRTPSPNQTTNDNQLSQTERRDYIDREGKNRYLLALNAIFKGDGISTGFGISGGVAHLISAQFTPSKKGCCLISVAPRLNANLCCGSFTSSPLIRSLAAKLTPGDSGNRRGWPTTLKRVARFPDPLKGVLPNKSSYKNMPKVHQSTALPCPSPLMISGAKYSWVPTNDIDRAPVGSAISSGKRLTWLAMSFLSFFSFFDLLEKKRGEKHVVGATHDGWMQAG